jgi:Ca2+-binding EF-hand superfamily protein
MFNNQCYAQRGLMNLEEFSNMVRLKGVLAKKLFTFFDMDENESIDTFEFLCALAFFTKTNVEDRLRSVFQIIDPDNNGSCSVTEINDLFEISFRIASKDVISDDEIKARLKQIAETYFLDENKPASLDQFSEIMLMDSELKKCLMDIGIFSKEEIEHQNHDNDIQLELAKFEVNNEETAQLILERQEIDVGKVINRDILAAFEEDVDVVKEESDVKTLNENIVPENLKRKANQGDAPNVIAKLEHVYGYRCHDSRNNIFLNPDGKVIFHASQIGIQLDTDTRQQKFVIQNTNDIICIDTFGNLTATGEIAGTPVLCLWDNQTMQVQSMYSESLSGGISHVRFSPDGSLLLAATLDDQRTVYLFDVYSLQMGEKQSRIILPQWPSAARLGDRKRPRWTCGS